MIRVLELSGSPRDMGRQHGEQVADLRPQIEAAMQSRLAVLHRPGVEWSAPLAEFLRSWQRHAPDTLEMLRGMAEALRISWDDYSLYLVATYLTSHLGLISPGQAGCTTWAAKGCVTVDGAPLLVKNRDQPPAEQALQCLARVRPARGYPYLCLTSAGSPAVHSSGINAVGLAVVDTHVPAFPVGPGITRFSLMMDLLETCADVPAAISYLPTVPHTGNGTLTLADAQGGLAVFEIAHLALVVIRPTEDFVISTNHFTAPATRMFFVDDEPPHLRGNSMARRSHVEAALRGARGKVDVTWSQRLMAQHGNEYYAICRHPEIDPNRVTVSAVVYSPRTASLQVTDGNPCRAPFEAFQVIA